MPTKIQLICNKSVICLILLKKIMRTDVTCKWKSSPIKAHRAKLMAEKYSKALRNSRLRTSDDILLAQLFGKTIL